MIVKAYSLTLGFKRPLVISWGALHGVAVVRVEIREGGFLARGECTPLSHFGESVEGTIREVEELAAQGGDGLSTRWLLNNARPGPARNALDAALWDLAAKRRGVPVWMQLGLALPRRIETAVTIGIDTPSAMATAAAELASVPLLKAKLGAKNDEDLLKAIRDAAPDTRLIVDVNGGWESRDLERRLRACVAANVEMIEQPLPPGADGALADVKGVIPFVADESLSCSVECLTGIARLYDGVNLKLDRCGGLTAALNLSRAANQAGLSVMVGCMPSTSLGCAPAFLLASTSQWVDLDAPLLLERDEEGGFAYASGRVPPYSPALWG